MDRDLLWYDVEKKEMLKFKGERLEFKYAMDYSLSKPKARLLPSVIASKPVVAKVMKKKAMRNVVITIEGTDKNDIHKWFKKYRLRNPTDAEIDSVGKKSIDFEIPMDEAEDFVESAMQAGFTFEV